jgi:acyl carrier protein
MAADELPDHIIRLVAEERGLSATDVRPEDRLLDDLGMDGDDAFEFFERFQKRFGIDLDLLDAHWDQHFGPEGSLPAWALIPALALPAWVLLVKLGIDPVWALTAPIMALIATAYVLVRRWKRRRRRPHIPVRVQDLIDAANNGVWSMRYPLG